MTSCGLKKYPKSPNNTNLPDIVQSYKYSGEETIKKAREKKKKEEDEKAKKTE